MKLKSLIIVFTLSVANTTIYAQHTNLERSSGITPMHKFFQQYADSTIIMEYPTDSYSATSYKIISNKDNFVNAFSYTPLDTSFYSSFKLKNSFPVELWTQLMARKVMFKNKPADVNIFFNLIDIPTNKLNFLWESLAKLKPWKLEDDILCPPNDKFPVVSQDSYSIIHLISKKEIRTLVYVSPDYSEKRCPGNKNRQAIIAIEKLFYEQIPFKK